MILSKEELARTYKNTRNYSRKLASLPPIDAFFSQPVHFVSPLYWHLAHTTWFFESFLLKNCVSNYKEYNPDFHFLFNSYYESLGPHLDRSKRGSIKQFKLQEILEYREYVDEAMEKFILEHELSADDTHRIVTGINHEQQHQELFIMDAKYTLSLHPSLPALVSKANKAEFDFLFAREENDEDWLEITEGVADVGYKGTGFCFDNELPFHKVYIQPVKLRKNLVTNGEYLEFIEAGGYQNHPFWLADGWDILQNGEQKKPLYWFKQDGEWSEYDLDGLNPLNKKLPVKHITYYEADAFCSWKGCALPTEFEREVAHDRLPAPQCWEWTASAYLPYPGYRKATGALGEYNGKFMVNQMVLKGGSVITPPDHSRASYRNFFQPDRSWQYSGIRLALRD